MMQINRWYMDDVTLGRVEVGSFKCLSLELPDRDNQVNISCIPDGRYKCRKINSPKNGLCFEIRNVPGRTHIQGHKGNLTKDVLGCIVFGNGIKDINKDGILDVTNSAITFNELMLHLATEFELEIS